MIPLTELLDRFRRGPELVATVITGAAGSELDFTPATGKWSVRLILAHLADSELVDSDRFRRIIAEDNPTLVGYDQDAWTRNLNYGKRKISDSLESFRRLRGENYELLKDLPEDAFERAGHHTERGRITLRQLLAIDAEHAENHARQIQEVRRQFKAVSAARSHPQ